MSSRPVSRRTVLAGIATTGGAAMLAALGCAPRRGSALVGSDDPAELDLRDAARAVRARRLSPVELTRSCLARIARLDPQLASFITVTAERALADARLAEHEVANGRWRGPLHGIPIAVKDNVDTAGLRTTAASAVFANRVPTTDAAVIGRLKAAGAIILDKLNMHEFALGTTSAISHAGAVHNPWDLERIAGGSSGGSGAAVAARLCFGAVGTDTGGSIRIPAACCGIVGLKPTFGVVSSQGVIPVSTSFDHVGPMCRTVTDTALMFRAMTDHPAAAYDVDAPASVASLRIGVCRAPCQPCEAPVAAEVQAIVDAAIDVIRSLVSEVREAEIPDPQELWRVLDAEASAFHAGHLAATPALYDPRTRADLLAMAPVSAEDYARLRAQLALHRAAIHRAFADVDLVIQATVPVLPQSLRDATEPFAMASCTGAFSSGGLPAISVPCGFSRSGLPIGLQIAGPPLADARVLALAQRYERATAWHRRRPPVDGETSR